MDLRTIEQLINSLKMLVETNNTITVPNHGTQNQLNAKSRTHHFIVDINRKGNRLPKFTLQLRDKSNKELALLRLDILGPAHPNPPGDFPFAGETISCPHLHIAHPEYGSSIAYPLNNEYASLFLNNEEITDLILILKRFLQRCNIGNITDYEFRLQDELF